MFAAWAFIGLVVAVSMNTNKLDTLIYKSNIKQIAFILIVSGPIVWITAALVIIGKSIETGIVKIYKMLE